MKEPDKPESKKLEEYIAYCSLLLKATAKPVFEGERLLYYTLDDKLCSKMAMGELYATYARMVERGEVPEHLRTERTI